MYVTPEMLAKEAEVAAPGTGQAAVTDGAKVDVAVTKGALDRVARAVGDATNLLEAAEAAHRVAHEVAKEFARTAAMRFENRVSGKYGGNISKFEVQEHSERYQRRLTGAYGRDVYLAYMADRHPQPDPIEEGVIQPGDKVMLAGRKGGLEGPGTLFRISRDAHGNLKMEYELDEPFQPEEGQAYETAIVHGAKVFHARDWARMALGGEVTWPKAVLGEIPRPSEAPRPR